MSTTFSKQTRQAGMVAIMVTLILMIVISLIVLGFAQISRRNQRQSLDRQLSTQAFYAAESGINDASELIKTAVASGATVANKPDCASTGGGFYASLSPVINANDQVEYTCLLVDPTPPRLVYSDIGTTSTIVPLVAESGTISSVTLSWQPKNSSSTVTTCPTGKSGAFSTVSAWTATNCSYGVLRFDLVPTAGSLSVGGLQSAAMTTFVVPLRPGSGGADPSSFGFAAGGANNLKGILCSQTECKLTITFASPQSEYYMRVSSLYQDVSLQVNASNASGGVVSFQNAQALVDATGKAQDVLRRIQVRLPINGSSSNQLSDFAIQSGEALCKRFSVMDGFFQSDANNAVPGVATSTTNQLCQ